ncbi:hypothetical protein ACFQ2B_27715 [Streptomyces stramineus]
MDVAEPQQLVLQEGGGAADLLLDGAAAWDAGKAQQVPGVLLPAGQHAFDAAAGPQVEGGQVDRQGRGTGSGAAVAPARPGTRTSSSRRYSTGSSSRFVATRTRQSS